MLWVTMCLIPSNIFYQTSESNEISRLLLIMLGKMGKTKKLRASNSSSNITQENERNFEVQYGHYVIEQGHNTLLRILTYPAALSWSALFCSEDSGARCQRQPGGGQRAMGGRGDSADLRKGRDKQQPPSTKSRSPEPPSTLTSLSKLDFIFPYFHLGLYPSLYVSNTAVQ